MKKMGLHEIRNEFLKFFEEKEHMILPSFSLIPNNDKSLLLINAGMAPLKPYFTGASVPPKKRVVTCQKCLRTGDIENVGKTDRHATFFEMLGNFSFGDYFKEEAIQWGWEFLTERLEIPKENIWVSIYLDDDDAFEIWNKKIGIPAERIVRLGKEDNFWELEVGPCGPCSEIYVDRGEKYGCGKPTCKPGCDCDRYVEVWNLVFSQFDKDEEGNYNPLPNPNIDTGMGLERITAVMEGANNIFEVEIINNLLKEVEKASGVTYGKNPKSDMSIRVITDHIRAMTFLVSDGVLPSNEGRGYVLRRLIRRAARHGKLLGIKGEFLTDMIGKVIELWKEVYPELVDREEHIKKVIRIEEEKFQATIDQGMEMLEKQIVEMRAKGQSVLDGEIAFKFYDTYGFPLDLTKEIFEEKNLKVDEEGFKREMEEQRERARNAREESGKKDWGYDEISVKLKDFSTIFKGYEMTSLKSKVLAIIKDEEFVERLEEGEEGIVVLNETPFYGEGGGQVGDTGILQNKDLNALVVDTKKTKNGSIFHIVEVKKGIIFTGDVVEANVDYMRRMDTARNHSATHLLHKALKKVLGDHVNQAGSQVTPNRLRFDFTHFEGISSEDIDKIESIVNSKVLEALEVNVVETSLKEARQMGATALFDEKYGDVVRLVQMGDYSKELCGGTHVHNTGDIGLFKILSESGIASGVRRIEAITGRTAYEHMKDVEKQLNDISSILKTNKKDVAERVKSLMVDVLTCKVDNMDINSLRNLGDEIKNLMGSGIIVLASAIDNKVSFVSMATKDVVNKGVHAGNIIKEVAKITGGGGGGRPDMAQAGGKEPSKIKEALNAVDEIVMNQLK